MVLDEQAGGDVRLVRLSERLWLISLSLLNVSCELLVLEMYVLMVFSDTHLCLQ